MGEHVWCGRLSGYADPAKVQFFSMMIWLSSVQNTSPFPKSVSITPVRLSHANPAKERGQKPQYYIRTKISLHHKRYIQW